MCVCAFSGSFKTSSRLVWLFHENFYDYFFEPHKPHKHFIFNDFN